MPNTQQNNEIEQISKEINLLQDRLKSLNQLQNGLMQIGRIRVKNGHVFLKPKKYKIYLRIYFKIR